jgi:Skp family chaperone for outer membrane proteins
MRPKWMYLLTIVAVVVTAGVFGRVTAQDSLPASRPAAGTSLTAVCNVSSILNNYTRVEDLKADMNKKMLDLKKEDDTRTQALDSLTSELGALAKGSKEYQTKRAEIDKQMLEHKVWAEMQQLSLQRQYQELTEEMYRSVLESVKAVALAKGFQLVIYQDEMDLASKNPDELRAKISQRKLLYNDPSLDITNAVLEHLNAQYAKTKK